MSREEKDAVKEPPVDGIECTPEGLVKTIAGCFGFLVSVVMVVALCLTAVGMFWTAQNFDRVTTSVDWGTHGLTSGTVTPYNGEYIQVNMGLGYLPHIFCFVAEYDKSVHVDLAKALC